MNNWCGAPPDFPEKPSRFRRRNLFKSNKAVSLCIQPWLCMSCVWIGGFMNVCMQGCMDGWMNGWMDGCMDAWLFVSMYAGMYGSHFAIWHCKLAVIQTHANAVACPRSGCRLILDSVHKLWDYRAPKPISLNQKQTGKGKQTRRLVNTQAHAFARTHTRVHAQTQACSKNTHARTHSSQAIGSYRNRQRKWNA